MKTIWDVIKSPVVTEKALELKDETVEAGLKQVLVFKVDRRATKPEIKQAVETLFKVKVEEVRVANYRGKRVFRFGRLRGQRAAWKKAYVTLKPGQKITEYADLV
ncbi:MAG TPA: 50S ribosomal protein L23 [Blastocatellia bacterium]|nr:50S ribosomal protein L23 [Blastocatellia bacterium]